MRVVSAVLRELQYALNKLIFPNALSLDWDNTLNFGDRINPFILSKLTSKRVVLDQSRYRKRFTCIGSILDRTYVDNTVVWGTGFIRSESYPKTKKLNIKAVRGPLTKQIFDNYSVPCPPIYGDPSIFMSDFIPSTNNEKKYTLGLIPHYAESFETLDKIISQSRFAADILLININDHPTKVVNMITCCSCVASSSLHGCIMADIYYVPCFHVKISSNVIGGNFKFDDYRLGLDSGLFHHLDLAEKGLDLDILLENIKHANGISSESILFAKERLINSFPFQHLSYSLN